MTALDAALLVVGWLVGTLLVCSVIGWWLRGVSDRFLTMEESRRAADERHARGQLYPTFDLERRASASFDSRRPQVAGVTRVLSPVIPPNNFQAETVEEPQSWEDTALPSRPAGSAPCRRQLELADESTNNGAPLRLVIGRRANPEGINHE